LTAHNAARLHPRGLSSAATRLKNVNLAFLAWNAYPGGKNGSTGVAEFLVRAPTAITADIDALHYSRAVRVKATSTIFGF